MSRLYLPYISPTSRVCLAYISPGGAGLGACHGAWGGAGDARGVAAAASDAGGVFEAPAPHPYQKVVTDEDLDGLDL